MKSDEKKQITIRVETTIINFFKKHAKRIGIPYQTMINLYLRDCVKMQRKPNFIWGLGSDK